MKIRRLIASWEGENLVKTSKVDGLIWVLPCVDLMDLSISKRVLGLVVVMMYLG